jgi:hypothetical protein
MFFHDDWQGMKNYWFCLNFTIYFIGFEVLNSTGYDEYCVE